MGGPPVLIALSGLPGSGKTTLARGLAAATGAVHLRVDSIETALAQAGRSVVADEGYRVAYAVAADNLRLGLDVVADAVNPIAQTRAAWRAVAEAAGARLLKVWVTCPDGPEHRRRVEGRRPDLPGQRLPTWAEVEARVFEPWDGRVVAVDTARLSLEAAVARVRAARAVVAGGARGYDSDTLP